MTGAANYQVPPPLEIKTNHRVPVAFVEPGERAWPSRSLLSLTTLIVATSALVLAGCEKQDANERAGSGSSSPIPASPAARVVQLNTDGCGLISRDEIQKIQEASVQDTKGAGSSDGRIRALQCYYVTQEPNRSVSIIVTQDDPQTTKPSGAVEDWNRIFRRYEPEGKEAAEEEALIEEEEEERQVPVTRIDGIGDKAFWVGTEVGAALYVLKGGAYVRVSLSGPDDEKIRIERSKRIAGTILTRL